MGSKKVGHVRNEVADEIDDEAEELGLSRAEYVRQRLNAGRVLFDAGKLDTELLSQLTSSVGSERPSEDISTIDDDLSQRILSILPQNEADSISTDELRTELFGTPDEQKEMIENTLRQLKDQGLVEPTFDGGVYRTND